MITDDIGDTNPYILNEQTRYKLKVTHYTLDGKPYRDMQEKAHERVERLKKIASDLGVEYTPRLSDIDKSMKAAEFKMKCFQHKKFIEEQFNEVLKHCTHQDLLDYFNNLPK